MKLSSSRRQTGVLALGTALLLSVIVAPPAQAAQLDPGNKVGDLVLTPGTIPSDSIGDWFWDEDGVITSTGELGCPVPPNDLPENSTWFVQPDGVRIPAALRFQTFQDGHSALGEPVRLSKENSELLGTSNFFYLATLADVKTDEVDFVYVCHDKKFSDEIADNSYFSVRLQRDGAGWKAVASTPSAAPTATAFTASSSRVNGKVDFVASVTAGEALVSGGTVDFVVDGTETRIATGTVSAGKATATSENAVDPTDGLNVKAVYRGASGFAASESAPQRVFGVRVPAPGSGDGDVTVVVPERDTPAGSVKFTAAATADLGEAAWTANGLSAIGSIAGAVVTDSRIDKSATWTVNGVADKFKTVTPASGSKVNEIPAAALSWVPAVKKGTTLPAGATVGAGAALGSPQTLLRWAQGGSGAGELKSEVGAELKLNAEGDFVAGNYSAKLTLTLV